MLQVQYPACRLSESTLNNYELVPELKQFVPEDWDDFATRLLSQCAMIDRPRGLHAAAARKRRAAEVTTQTTPGRNDSSGILRPRQTTISPDHEARRQAQSFREMLAVDGTFQRVLLRKRWIVKSSDRPTARRTVAAFCSRPRYRVARIGL